MINYHPNAVHRDNPQNPTDLSIHIAVSTAVPSPHSLNVVTS